MKKLRRPLRKRRKRRKIISKNKKNKKNKKKNKKKKKQIKQQIGKKNLKSKIERIERIFKKEKKEKKEKNNNLLVKFSDEGLKNLKKIQKFKNNRNSLYFKYLDKINIGYAIRISNEILRTDQEEIIPLFIGFDMGNMYLIFQYLDVFDIMNLKCTCTFWYKLIDWRMIAFCFQRYINKKIFSNNDYLNLNDNLYYRDYVLRYCLIPNDKTQDRVIELINYCFECHKVNYFYYIYKEEHILILSNKYLGAKINFNGDLFVEYKEGKYEKKKGYNIIEQDLETLINYDKNEGFNGFVSSNLLENLEIKTSHSSSSKNTKYDDIDESFFNEKKEIELQKEFLVEDESEDGDCTKYDFDYKPSTSSEESESESDSEFEI